MNISKFGKKFTQNSGILQLMDDLGNALNSDQPINMLGGGNPASIAAVNEIYLETLQTLVNEEKNLLQNKAIDSIGNYSTPQGDAKLIQALVDFFNRHYQWNITPEHIALTNGSQNAFFYLFNLFAGEFDDGTHKSILLPLAPEYIGYADAHVNGQHFIAIKPEIEYTQHDGQDGFFKYRVDFNSLENLPELQHGKIGAICCSRPTNPTGNVLTDDEMAHLDQIAQKYNIPLLIDNAYGMPFPNIIHKETTLTWHENIVL
ncbi:MAG: aminotransferase class I/II-fold pyridoxal phosphate-dependent enzyme, partial [Acinetobacter sp.]|nr:aminotransferase class I/II-fold pyridoxal phosphate-dependent enzyme [Acinetobacter sp.]